MFRGFYYKIGRFLKGWFFQYWRHLSQSTDFYDRCYTSTRNQRQTVRLGRFTENSISKNQILSKKWIAINPGMIVFGNNGLVTLWAVRIMRNARLISATLVGGQWKNKGKKMKITLGIRWVEHKGVFFSVIQYTLSRTVSARDRSNGRWFICARARAYSNPSPHTKGQMNSI